MSIDVTRSAALDIDGAVAKLGGDRELLAEMFVIFMEDAPKLVADLRAAAAAGDAPRVRLASHALKGMLAGCGGVCAAEAAERIERTAEHDELANISPLVAGLVAEFNRVAREAVAFRP
jgi:HPt (histidine-containing phosphotransfer) domain-containing protein